MSSGYSKCGTTVKKISLIFFSLLFLVTLSYARRVIIIGPGGAVDGTAPLYSSGTIGSDGTTVTLTFSEGVVVDTPENNEFNIDCDGVSGAGVTMAYQSGSGTVALVFAAGSTIQNGEGCNVDCVEVDADEFEDAAGNDLATFDEGSITNNSSQGLSYYATETFETTGPPGYDNTSPCGSAVCIDELNLEVDDENTATSGLYMVGSYCLELASSGEEINITVADDDEYYIVWRWRYSATVASLKPILRLYGNNTLIGQVVINSSEQIKAKALTGQDTAVFSNQTPNVSRWYKVRYKHVGATNNEVELWVWDGVSSWGSSVSQSNGNKDFDIDKIELINESGQTFYYDGIKIDTSDIADPTT